MSSGYWKGRDVAVTGGASFIGSHLVSALVERGAHVRVADDFRSGRPENLDDARAFGEVEILRGDLHDPAVAASACAGAHTVFHLAADHGGRGYVDLCQAGPAGNLALDMGVFRAAMGAGVTKVVFASSGCVYPTFLQMDVDRSVSLREEDVGPPYQPDQMYGWAKLSAELALQALTRELGLQAVSCRYFSVYGPRALEDHALMAMIARAFVGADPFEVWGDGTQIRSWTYVDDIVEGTILAAELISDASAVNIGSTEAVTVREAVMTTLAISGRRTEIVLRPDMPVGPRNRVADCERARRLLGWTPRTPFAEGLRRTIAWYFATHDREQVRRLLDAGALFKFAATRDRASKARPAARPGSRVTPLVP